MQLGASIPVADIGTGPAALRDYAQAAEELDAHRRPAFMVEARRAFERQRRGL